MGEVRFLVTEAAREAFSELRETHPDETFYAFALAVSPGEGRIGASANTEEGLRRAAERYAGDGYGSVEALTANTAQSLRWRIADWAFRHVGVERFREANEHAAGAAGLGDEVVGELVGAFRDLNREDFFGWGPERDAVVLLIDAGDPDDLLELARDVNPAVPFARLQDALG